MLFESFILGMVQGIAEWLPVSSEAMIVLVKTNMFPDSTSFTELISFAIFLHIGTLLAVVVYYWKTISKLVAQLFHYRSLGTERHQLHFVVIATGVSGIFGLLLLHIVEQYQSIFEHEEIVNLSVAGFLLVTAILLYISERNTHRYNVPLTTKRAVCTGLFQGLAAIPGISRSGATIAGMGILGIDKERALELSFILSIPIVLLANIVLNLDEFTAFSLYHFVALCSAFVFGSITIDMLLRIVRRVRFSYVVGSFAVLLILVAVVL
ncbi:undecaprenyl-diphosphate phosphatase [Patescibacteria group bacterium]|nr:undecaprenyl-diphosphate phosphatase [Patescibacteria group bacterium]